MLLGKQKNTCGNIVVKKLEIKLLLKGDDIHEKVLCSHAEHQVQHTAIFFCYSLDFI